MHIHIYIHTDMHIDIGRYSYTYATIKYKLKNTFKT